MTIVLTPAGSVAAVALRPIEPGDAAETARIVYEAFAGSHDRHRFARDFPTLDAAAQLVDAFIGHPSIHGVVAELEGARGRLELPRRARVDHRRRAHHGRSARAGGRGRSPPHGGRAGARRRGTWRPAAAGRVQHRVAGALQRARLRRARAHRPADRPTARDRHDGRRGAAAARERHPRSRGAGAARARLRAHERTARRARSAVAGAVRRRPRRPHHRVCHHAHVLPCRPRRRGDRGGHEGAHHGSARRARCPGRVPAAGAPVGPVPLGPRQRPARRQADDVHDHRRVPRADRRLEHRSPAAARSFYHGLFGWRTEIVDTEPGGPLVVLAYNGATLNASFFVADNGEPAHWRPCFTVESTEAAVERVRELGGTVLVEPEDNVDGRLAVALDPHGAPFALFAGEIDP